MTNDKNYVICGQCAELAHVDVCANGICLTCEMSNEAGMVRCKRCGAATSALAVFPGGVCLACHGAEWDNVPVSEMPAPDFVRALRGRRRK